MSPRELVAQVAPTVVAMLVASGGVAYYNHAQREIGRRDVLLSAVRVGELRAIRRADSLAKAYRVDTVRLWHLVRTTDTLTATVEQWKHDTVEVVRYVQKADSTIRACTATVRTCEQRVAAEREAGDSARRAVVILRAEMPSASRRWAERAGSFVIGLVLGRVVP